MISKSILGINVLHQKNINAKGGYVYMLRFRKKDSNCLLYKSSISSMQEQSKKLVTGKLKEVACQKIDEQTEALVSMIGDNQVAAQAPCGRAL